MENDMYIDKKGEVYWKILRKLVALCSVVLFTVSEALKTCILYPKNDFAHRERGLEVAAFFH
jgi:hypothetical protein